MTRVLASVCRLRFQAGDNGNSRDGGFAPLTRGACAGLASTSAETLGLFFFMET
jgi:hypothetical protein